MRIHAIERARGWLPGTVASLPVDVVEELIAYEIELEQQQRGNG